MFARRTRRLKDHELILRSLALASVADSLASVDWDRQRADDLNLFTYKPPEYVLEYLPGRRGCPGRGRPGGQLRGGVRIDSMPAGRQALRPTGTQINAADTDAVLSGASRALRIKGRSVPARVRAGRRPVDGQLLICGIDLGEHLPLRECVQATAACLRGLRVAMGARQGHVASVADARREVTSLKQELDATYARYRDALHDAPLNFRRHSQVHVHPARGLLEQPLLHRLSLATSRMQADARASLLLVTGRAPPTSTRTLSSDL